METKVLLRLFVYWGVDYSKTRSPRTQETPALMMFRTVSTSFSVRGA